MNTPRVTLALLLPALLAFSACDGGTTEPDGLRITTAALAPCTDNENLDRQFPSNADRVVVRLTGGPIPAEEPIVTVLPQGAGGDDGQVLIEDLPPGEGMILEAVACLGSEPTWAGVTGDVVVTLGETNPVGLFLTPVGGLSCVGTPDSASTQMHAGHAFGATWSGGGSAWVLGGFSSFEVQTERELRATARVDRYDRVESSFVEAARLLDARGMATAQPLDDGRIRIIGGATEVFIELGGSLPPLWTTAANAPSPAVEIYDPVSETSQAGPGLDLPALPAVAVLDDGRALAVGGVGEGNVAASVAWVIGADGATSVEVPLPQGRYGATVVAGAGSQALVWGGNVDGVVEDVALWVDAEAGTAVQLTGNAELPVPFMAAGAFLGAPGDKQRFLLVGGTNINPEGAAARFTTTASTVRVLLVEVDPAEGTFSAADLELPEGQEGLFRRAAAQMVTTETDDILLLGGFTSFSSDPACPDTDNDSADCLQQSVPRFRISDKVTLVGEEPIVSNVGTLGATLETLGDGSWLLGGGLRTVTQGAIDTGAGLLRFRVPDPGLCAHGAPN